MTKAILISCMLVLLSPAYAQSSSPEADKALVQIPEDRRKCSTDNDCEFVRVKCESCCPDLNDSVAVNKIYAHDYRNSELCTAEHNRSCGVPECGLESPAPLPACHNGMCVLEMRYYGQPANPQ